MPAEPSDADIQAVQEFTSLPRSDAIRYLKVSCAFDTVGRGGIAGERFAK